MLDRLIAFLLIFVYLDLKTATLCEEIELRKRLVIIFVTDMKKNLIMALYQYFFCKEKQKLQTYKPDKLFTNLIRGVFHKTSEN